MVQGLTGVQKNLHSQFGIVHGGKMEIMRNVYSALIRIMTIMSGVMCGLAFFVGNNLIGFIAYFIFVILTFFDITFNKK